MTHNKRLTLGIDGMSCASCVGRVEAALSAVDGIGNVSVNLASETAELQVQNLAALHRAVQTLETLGYPARTSVITLTITSMSCASCVGRVDKALAAVPGVQSVVVNLAARCACRNTDIARVCA